MSFLDKDGLITYDNGTKENQGYWRKNQAVEVGDVRKLTGKDNATIYLVCEEAGTTGDTQPTFTAEDIEGAGDLSENLATKLNTKIDNLSLSVVNGALCVTFDA